MATMDSSPGLYSGQSWAVWEEVDQDLQTDDDVQKFRKKSCKVPDDNMKLRKEDLPLFGLCPAQDQCFLVVCERCGQILKPQALQAHIEQRHGLKSPTGFSPHVSHKQHYNNRPNTQPQSSRTSNTPSPKGSGRPHSSHVTTAIKNNAPSKKSSSHKAGKSSSSNNSARHNTHSKKGTTNTSMTADMQLPFVKVKKFIPTAESAAATKASLGPPDVKHNIDKFKSEISIKTEPPGGDYDDVQIIESGIIDDKVMVKMETTKTDKVNVERATKLKEEVLNKDLLETGHKLKTDFTHTVKTETGHKVKIDSSSNVKHEKQITTNKKIKTETSSEKVRTTSGSKVKLETGNKVKLETGNNGLYTTDGSTISAHKWMPPKPQKLILCKDREYDADKHCGVIVPETNKACCRSLTCKSHSLSLRRSVAGRSKSFDQLVKEHKARKEEILKHKLKIGGKVKPSKSPSSSKSNSTTTTKTITTTTTGSSTPVTTPIMPQLPAVVAPMQQMPYYHKTKDGRKLMSRSKPTIAQYNAPPLPEYTSRVSSDGDSDSDMDTDFTTLHHHPRPLVWNTFGARRHNGGSITYSRKYDALRSAFGVAVERHLHPPPSKKLCVPSKLPQQSHHPSDTKDPYEFHLADSRHSKNTSHIDSPSVNANRVSKPSSKTKSIKSKPVKGSSVHNTVDIGSVKRNHAGGSVSATAVNLPSGAVAGFTNSIPIGALTGNITATGGFTLNHPIAGSFPVFPTMLNTNLGSNNLAHFAAPIGVNKNTFFKNANILKDLSIVVTNIDGNLSNGQLSGIPVQLVANNHLTLSAKDANYSLGGSAGAIDTKGIIMGTKIYTSDGGAVLSHSNGFQEAAQEYIRPKHSTLASCSTQSSPCTTPSPQFRSDCISPLPNGYVASPLLLKASSRSSTPSPIMTAADMLPNNSNQFTKLIGKPVVSVPRHQSMSFQLAPHQRLIPTNNMTQPSPFNHKVHHHRGPAFQLPKKTIKSKTSGKMTVQPLSLAIPSQTTLPSSGEKRTHDSHHKAHNKQTMVSPPNMMT